MQRKFILAVIGAFFFGGAVTLLGTSVIEQSPERQARSEIARCLEMARIMQSEKTFQAYLESSDSKNSSIWELAPRVDSSKEKGYALPFGVNDPIVPPYGLTMACIYGRRN